VLLSDLHFNNADEAWRNRDMRISGITYAVRKTHRIRKTLKIVIVLLLLVILAVAALSGYKGWKLLHPDRKPVDKFSSNIVPEYRDISFRKSDSSIVLKGWLFQAKKSGRAVILAHSYGRNRLQFGLETLDLVKEFLNRGYNVFTFDMRNSGESGGKTSTFGYGEKEDVKAAVNYLNSQGMKRITLMGFSTGASASILAAAEGASVDAVIADSPYADLKSYFLNNLDRWTGLPAFPFNRTITAGLEFAGVIDMANTSPVDSVTADKPPRLLLIHAKGDDMIPITGSIELFQAYSALNPSGVEFWQLESNGHADGFVKYKSEYLQKVFAFLDKVYSEE